jgi:divalent metal cation (Fe/Co/Zn/Cd) transporter
MGAEFSLPGLILCVLAVPIMYFLSRRKLALAETLGSRALKADAVESITCGWLSLVVVAALIVQLAIGAWWVDAVASLGIVWFLIREGREAKTVDENLKRTQEMSTSLADLLAFIRAARARAETPASAADMSRPSGPSVGLGEHDVRGPNAWEARRAHIHRSSLARYRR